MKTYIYVFIVLLTGCSYSAITQKNNNEIKGSGNIVTKLIDAGNITEIKNTGVLNIIVTESSKQEIKIETDDNIMQYIKYETNGNALIFSTEENSKNIDLSPTKANIYITSNQILLIENEGVGNIYVNNYNIAADLQINNSGVGNINTENITGNSLKINNSGVGSVNLKGKLDSLTINNDGVGNINADEIPVNILFLYNSGVGNIKLNAVKEISIQNSGVGKIKYKGNPVIKSLN